MMDDYHLQSLLASILYQEGKRSEAAQLARTLTDRYPSEGEAQYILAVLAADADRLDEAARLVRSAASRRLTPQTRANAVSIAADLGDIELAESLARQAVQDAPRTNGECLEPPILLITLCGRDRNIGTHRD